MNISYRPALESDTTFAKTTHHLSYREVVEKQYGPEANQDSFFANDWKPAQFTILLCDDIPCGYACIETLNDYIHVRELVVHPNFQGKGIGSTLLRKVMAQAASCGMPVKLATHHQNRALALYRRLGFREFDRSDTHVLMEWSGPQRT
jgi:ribosomal protein S18 acetylase RimI-like enzyme